jgi:hypothetical protein
VKKTWIGMGMTLGLFVALGGCGDDAETGDAGARGREEDPDRDAGAGDTGDTGDAGDADEEPIYLMTTSVTDIDGNATLYALLRRELDLDISTDDLTAEKARPFAGYSGIAAIDGQVVVGDSKTPFATKFDVGDDLKWTQVGGKLNFSDYVSDDQDGLNFYFQAIRGADMYFFYGADRTSRLHWNTKAWKLEEAYEDTHLPSRKGWTLGSTGNRTGVRDFKGPVVQTFNLSNDETDLGAEQSWIAVYDEETHEEKSVIEVPCPGLQQTTMDEEGRLYVSTTFNMPTLALYGKEPASCVVRLNADGTLDEAFGENDLRAWTGGFYGVNFRALGGGMAVANVLHHDRLKDVDWDGEVDPEVAVEIGGEWTDAGYTPEDPTLWELELIDMEAGTSTPITGWKPEHDPNSYTIFFPIDGHVFISFQIDPFGDPRNAMYELDVKTAKVKFVGDVVGELNNLERVR